MSIFKRQTLDLDTPLPGLKHPTSLSTLVSVTALQWTLSHWINNVHYCESVYKKFTHRKNFLIWSHMREHKWIEINCEHTWLALIGHL